MKILISDKLADEGVEILEAVNDFEVDWNAYRNTLLTTDDQGLKKIKTKLFKIYEI